MDDIYGMIKENEKAKPFFFTGNITALMDALKEKIEGNELRKPMMCHFNYRAGGDYVIDMRYSIN